LRYAPLVFALWIPLCPAGVDSRNPSVEPLTFLWKHLDFSTSELEQVRRGSAVAKKLRTEKQEVAAFGVVRINAPRIFFLSKFRDIETFKKSAAVPKVRKFSDPPRIEDVQDLVFNAQDLKSIRECRVAHCDNQAACGGNGALSKRSGLVSSRRQ
jgi:hypothetical protein